MKKITDQTGQDLVFTATPKRIISLVPSQTELLYSLGLNDSVVGITKFCVHPVEWFKNKSRVGGTKNVNIDQVLKLQPDCIIANKEENVKEQIEALKSIAPVYVSDVHNLESAFQMMHDIGYITGKQTEANEIIEAVTHLFNNLQPVKSYKTAYLIWRGPYMTVGGDTFIHNIMEQCGLKNIFSEQIRYPEIQIKDLKDRGCEVVLLSSEPYPFSQKHVNEILTELTDVKIILVDGEMFSWYGSRLLHAPTYFNTLIDKLNQA